MINKSFLIWINILLFLLLLLIVFEMQSVEKEIYKDPVLTHLGMSDEEIFDLYGEPGREEKIGGPGGKEFFYEEEGISFIFAGESDVVNNMRVLPGKELMGVEVGMTFDEIVEILGEPVQRGFDAYSGRYSLIYFLGKNLNGMGEVELWFSASSDDAPTSQAEIFWKKYWQDLP